MSLKVFRGNISLRQIKYVFIIDNPEISETSSGFIGDSVLPQNDTCIRPSK